MKKKKTITQKRKTIKKTIKTKKPKKIDFDLSNRPNIIQAIRNYKDENLILKETLKEAIGKHLQKIILSSEVGRKYKTIFLYDSYGSIAEYDLNKIKSSFKNIKGKKNIMLIIHSGGGSIEPAYFISKQCKEHSNKFIVVIPRKAKSAATLLSLGADEIHMGDISQLGPIDPQIGNKSVLALGNAVEYLAKLCEKYPKSSEMFAKYLYLELELGKLGHFERISKSAVQYAEILLENKKFPKQQTSEMIAKHFTFDYKDHGFVIDKQEAKKYLGDYIKDNTPELKLGEEIYSWIDDFDGILNIFKNQYLVISGDCTAGGILFQKLPK